MKPSVAIFLMLFIVIALMVTVFVKIFMFLFPYILGGAFLLAAGFVLGLMTKIKE